MDSLLSMKVVVSEHIVEESIEFPYDRFVEYGPEDAWLTKYGIGKYVYKPTAWKVNIPSVWWGFDDLRRDEQIMYVHPTIYKALKKEIASRKDLPVIKPTGAVLCQN